MPSLSSKLRATEFGIGVDWGKNWKAVAGESAAWLKGMAATKI